MGFILAAVGSAVGLGNIWAFPFQAGRNGGAAFVVVYLIVVFLVGLPAMLSEFVVGRGSKRNPVDAFSELGFDDWRFAGGVGAFSAFWILAFYSVVGGWVVRYVFGSLTGAYFGDTTASAYFMEIAMGLDAVATHGIFMLLTVGIVVGGVRGGIERATKVMVPTIIVFLIGLGAWAFTLSNAGAGYEFYLSPELSAITSNLDTIVPYAVGQAFFTLSLGMGAMITYSSYLGEDDSLPADGSTIVVLNTVVAVLAGLAIFPLLFHSNPGIDLATAGGSSTAFTTIGGAFASLGSSGQVLAFVFFLTLLLAALSSAISLLEVVTSYVVENTGLDRTPTVAGLGAVVFAFGIPSATGIFGMNGITTLTWYNDIAYNLLLPVSVLAVSLFVGWVYGSRAVDEVGRGSGVGATFDAAWLWFVRVVVPAAVTFTLVLGIQSLLVSAGVLAEPVFLG
jgi:NSS family neurotransmitter:Na+ symporter